MYIPIVTYGKCESLFFYIFSLLSVTGDATEATLAGFDRTHRTPSLFVAGGVLRLESKSIDPSVDRQHNDND